MTTDEKLNYVIQLLNEITAESKTIGDLNDYELGSDDDNAFIGVFTPNTEDTLKFSVAEIVEYLASNAVDLHTHTIDQIENLGAALLNVYTDSNGSHWIVKRTVENYDFTVLLEMDKIEGWEDESAPTRWIEGIVLDDTIVLPADIDDVNKFFITNEKLKV